MKTQKNSLATVAKIRVMYGRRFRPDDYADMLNSRNVPEAAEFLKSTEGYRTLLAPVDTNTVHRGMLEDLLRKGVFLNYLRVTGFEQLDRQSFYNFRILKEEINAILMCIRCLNSGSTDFIHMVKSYTDGYLSFNPHGLAQVTDFGGLLEFLKKTKYYNLLAFFRPEGNEKIDYTGCEVRLRTQYYSELYEAVRGFDGETRKLLENCIGNEIDVINIINSYRMTVYFHEDAASIRRLMIPFGHISTDKIENLYAAVDSDDFMNRLYKTHYGRAIRNNGFDKYDLETAALKLKHKNFSSALSKAKDSAVAVYAFDNLMETEVGNIIKVIEGIRYSVPSKQIEDLLII